LRTDSVSRGLFISLLTRETIFLSFSIRLFFFMKRPFFERRAVNYRIEFGADLSQGISQKDETARMRVYPAAALSPPPRISPAAATEQKKH
jgi:hypothetical protein